MLTTLFEDSMEVQLAINPKLAEFKSFDSEEEAKEFTNNWKEDQLSSISEGKKVYIALPNIVSKTISECIQKVTDKMKLNIPLGFEWIVNKTWYGCH